MLYFSSLLSGSFPQVQEVTVDYTDNCTMINPQGGVTDCGAYLDDSRYMGLQCKCQVNFTLDHDIKVSCNFDPTQLRPCSNKKLFPVDRQTGPKSCDWIFFFMFEHLTIFFFHFYPLYILVYTNMKLGEKKTDWPFLFLLTRWTGNDYSPKDGLS